MFAARFALLGIGLFAASMPVSASFVPFISELHYDNTGRDVDEFVAVTVPRGFDPSGWQVALYNGADGVRYAMSELLGGSHTGQKPAIELPVTFGALQNGPDAVALVADTGVLVDFIAYEQIVVASEGPAAGVSAKLLPLGEDGQTPVGSSLQRVGGLDEWSWIVAAASPGGVNAGLQLAEAATERLPLSSPPAAWLAGLCALALAGRRRALAG